MKSLLFLVAVLSIGMALSADRSLGQKKDAKDKKVEPRVVVALPLAARPGAKQQHTLRGFALDKATEVKCSLEGAAIKIVSKGQAGVPDKNPEKVGDTQVVVELTLPAKLTEAPTLLVVTPDGTTTPHALLLETTREVVRDKEPNDGFRQAQELKLPCVVDGEISRQRDVDVFRFKGTKGQTVSAEILAARHGSALDSILTLYDSDHQQIASNDDHASGLDSRLEVRLPKDGEYYLVLMDAHDTGSSVHVYRLLVK